MKNNLKFLLLFSVLLSSPLICDELTVDLPQMIWNSDCTSCRPPDGPPIPPPPIDDNIVVDLVDPIYTEGVLSTEKGGVLTAPGLRIQAQNITYARCLENDPPVFTVSCVGNILIDYLDWVLVGDELYYDFATHRGYLINGRTASPPWFISGREVLLLEDGELVVLDGVITTSEGEVEDLSLCAARICLSPDRVISANNITLRVNQIPFFWFPKIQHDLKNIGRSPFGFRFGWGGFLGSYASVLYHFLSWRELEATARLDAFIGKGVGVGIETSYDPSWRPTSFYTRNYFANDISLDDPFPRDRYRFQGTYYDRIFDTTINGLYDIVSDGQMAADYTTHDFELKTAGRTELELHRQTNAWIANLYTRVRVNHFQSVNQELPTFRMDLHPLEIPYTGIIFQNTFEVSYLDYVFSDDVKKAKDISSGRFAVHPFLYRPFFLGPVTATPEVGFIGIAYSDSPEHDSAGQALGEFGLKIESLISKCTEGWRHVAEPYLHYSFLTTPRVATDNHYIFTIEDGWDRLNLLRFGVRNSYFCKAPCGVARPFWIDIWANAFFSTPTIPSIIPRGYLNVEWMPAPTIFIAMDSAWHFEKKQLDFYNMRIDWTLSESLAVGLEYRHRSRYDWRKADFYNFILESVRKEKELLDSPLSDRRDTLLLRTFCRINPNWTAKLDLRHGWNRRFARKNYNDYLEYQFELSRVIFQHWRATFIYEKREAGNRYSFSFLMEPGPPPGKKICY